MVEGAATATAPLPWNGVRSLGLHEHRQPEPSLIFEMGPGIFEMSLGQYFQSGQQRL